MDSVEKEKLARINYRKGIAYKEAVVSVIGNLLLAGFKMVLGYFSASRALMADAIHSLSDMLTSVVIMAGYKISSKKADEKHPFGHGRMEHVTTLVMSALLMIAGWELLIDSYKAFLHKNELHYNVWIVIGVFLTIIVKEWMSRYSSKLGKDIDSGALEADAWHHRLDAISSGIVIIGIVMQHYTGWHVDGIAGMIVSLFVIYSGIEIAKEAVDKLLGEPPTEEEIALITQIAKEDKRIKGVHDIMVHRYGQEVTVSLHIEISADISLMEAHDISDDTEKRILSKLKARAVVHVDPIDFTDPRIKEIYDFLKQKEKELEYVRSIHDPRIIAGKHLAFDVVPLSRCNVEKMRKELIKEIKEKFTYINEVYIEFDPLYFY